MFKKEDIVTCKKDFYNNGYYYKGDTFRIHGSTETYITLRSATQQYVTMLHSKLPHYEPSILYGNLFYSVQELRRLKIEKIKNGKRR